MGKGSCAHIPTENNKKTPFFLKKQMTWLDNLHNGYDASAAALAYCPAGAIIAAPRLEFLAVLYELAPLCGEMVKSPALH